MMMFSGSLNCLTCAFELIHTGDRKCTLEQVNIAQRLQFELPNAPDAIPIAMMFQVFPLISAQEHSSVAAAEKEYQKE
jgi:hypothetical protein